MQCGSRAWVWRTEDEEFHPDCIDYRKRANCHDTLVVGQMGRTRAAE